VNKHARARARIVVSALAAALLSVGSLAGSASAGDTRVIYIGDPDGSGVLEASIASAGNQTGFEVQVRNTGKQNVTHVVIGIGSDAATSTMQPAGSSLPAGSTVVAIYGDGACSIEADFSGAMCAFDSLPARSSVKDTIVVTTPSAGSFDFWASVKLDENTSDAGANTDSFFSSGHLDVDPADGDHFGTFLLPNQGGTVGTGLGNIDTTNQGTLVTVPGRPAGTPVSTNETADPPTNCAGGVSCFGALVRAHIADGATITPYLTWTFRWNTAALPKGFSASQAGVVHFPDAGRAVLIPNTKKNLCSATRTLDCVVSSLLTKDYFELVIQTASNGGVKGYG
jgi:hypothetical protein